MPEPTSPEVTQFLTREALALFDEYVHGIISRRSFLEKCAVHVGSMAVAAAVLAALSPDFARAQVVPPTDDRIAASTIDIASPNGHGTIRAYLARPAGRSRKRNPVVLVVHENRGLNPHIQDIARRLAVDGFLALAPDALTSVGGYPGDEDKARALFAQLDQAKVAADFVAAARHAEAIEGGNGKLGVVGFCFGGAVANMLATRIPTLRAAVPFYGAPPPLGDVPAIKAELLIHFAGNDTRINSQWPAYQAALDKAGIRYRAETYAGVEHGFNNDTTPRFDKAAAALAWGRTLELFRRTLV
jgi:carboxymethylenebutenolidase